MPCHVPATSLSFRRPLPSLPLSPPSIAAKLDLRKPGERETQDLVRRFCTGRWPVWQPLGMRRLGRTLYLAVAWTRCRKPAPYSVVGFAQSARAPLEGRAERGRGAQNARSAQERTPPSRLSLSGAAL
jgi:hypothetical protein